MCVYEAPCALQSPHCIGGLQSLSKPLGVSQGPLCIRVLQSPSKPLRALQSNHCISWKNDQMCICMCVQSLLFIWDLYTHTYTHFSCFAYCHLVALWGSRPTMMDNVNSVWRLITVASGFHVKPQIVTPQIGHHDQANSGYTLLQPADVHFWTTFLTG